MHVITTLKHSGIDLARWLTGFDSVKEGVENSVSIIKNHPLLPKNVTVHGLIIDPETGQLEVVVDGTNPLNGIKFSFVLPQQLFPCFFL